MDAVITYVDCTKIDWLNNYKKYVKNPISEQRFRSWGTLNYQINGIRKNMPFINNIFIVVSNKSQLPCNLNADITIITHDMIIPEEYLPTFNSCTIEMFLHKIPGLSEEFVYFNDDTFVIQPTNETDFFINYKPCLHKQVDTYFTFDSNSIFRQQCINSTKIFKNSLSNNDILNSSKFLIQEHCARPMLISTCNKVWDLCGNEIINSLTRTRHNRNVNAYLFNNYDILTNNFIDINKHVKFFKLDENSIDDIIDYMKHPDCSQLCINDNCTNSNFHLVKEKLNKLHISNVNDIQNEPLLSIIIPIYNTEKYLAKCLLSIAKQQYKNFECILINDGSIDNSEEICKKICEQDNRFKYFYKENSGVANTRNYGLDIAAGKYVTFVDSDDWVSTNRFTLPIHIMEGENAEFIQCGFNIYKNNKNTAKWIYPEGLFTTEDKIILSSSKYDIGHAGNKIYKTDVLNKHHIRFMDCDFCEDLIFNTTVFTIIGYIKIIQDPLYNYNIHTNSLSKNILPLEKINKMIFAIKNMFYQLNEYKNFNEVKTIFLQFISNAMNRNSQNIFNTYIYEQLSLIK